MLKILNKFVLSKTEAEDILKYCISLSDALIMLNDQAASTPGYNELIDFIDRLENLVDR